MAEGLGDLYSPAKTARAIPHYIAERVPEWPPVFYACMSALRTFFMAVGDAHIEKPKSATTILLIAANEFQDLIVTASHGEGRRALASARTLYELNIALHDVMASQDMDDRYSEWGKIGTHLSAKLPLEQSTLSGKQLKAHRHHQRRQIRDTKADYETAIARFGPQYRRDWTGGKALFDRATAHSQADLYEFYRVASGVLHGTQLGASGLMREEFTTTRLGPSLTWAPTALLYGTESFDRIINSARPLLLSGVRDIAEALRAVRGVWPDFDRALGTVDLALWPSESVPSPMAVYGIGRAGSGKWFVWEPDFDVICEAETPRKIPDHIQEAISEARAEAEATDAWNDPEVPKGILGYLTIVCAGVMTDVKRGATWEHAGMIMIQDPLSAYSYEETAPKQPKHRPTP